MPEVIGQIWYPDQPELVDQGLREIRLGAVDAGVDEPPTAPGTDFHLRMLGAASIATVGLSNTALAEADANELTAEGIALETKRIELGLPEVVPTGASGRVVPDIQGSTTIVEGSQLQNTVTSLRYEVVGTYVAPVDGDEIEVKSIDTGTATNAVSGTELTWVSPPVNVGTVALVSEGQPLQGGSDEETDERKRARIQNVRQNRPAGGNWGYVREVSQNATGEAQETFVYAALGGPATTKVVPVRLFDRDRNDYSRTLSDSGLAAIRGALWGDYPDGVNNVVLPSAPELVDVALALSIPDSVLAGGDGTGWSDASPWPNLVVADGGRAVVASYSGVVLDVTANTTVSPVERQTNIGWWSPQDRKFYVATVVSVDAAGPPTWTLTLNKPLVDSTGANPAAGDYISPAAVNMVEYGNSWLDIMEGLGPGELPQLGGGTRAIRHPYATREWPSELTLRVYGQLTTLHAEIVSVAESYANKNTPTVPSTIDDQANIFSPQHFGIYKP